MLLGGCELLFPDVAAEMYERADLFCTTTPVETPVPTVSPTDHGPCNQTGIDDGSQILLSIDSAYEILADICNNIGSNAVALLDGGYINGSSCTAEKTDQRKNYTLMYCAYSTNYCDYGDLLLSPNFEVDVESTLVLVKLTDMLLNFWGINEWGLELTMLRSMQLNAVGIYLNSLAFTEALVLYVENSVGVTIAGVSLSKGKNSEAAWFFAITEDDSGNGVQLDYGNSYKLLWNFPSELKTSPATYIETKIRVYSNPTLPLDIEEAFTVENFLVGSRDVFGLSPGTYLSDTRPT
jgi:hypothetical protein